jgi:hypothetical protein
MRRRFQRPGVDRPTLHPPPFAPCDLINVRSSVVGVRIAPRAIRWCVPPQGRLTTATAELENPRRLVKNTHQTELLENKLFQGPGSYFRRVRSRTVRTSTGARGLGAVPLSFD